MKSLLAILISSALVVSGYSQTRNVLVNSNNAVVSPTNFWSADASNARAGLGLGTAATNPASAFQPSSATLSNLASSNAVDLTNLQATNIVGTIPASNISSLSLTNISGTLAISNGGSGATTAGEARTNFELGASWLTNTVASNFRTAIGLPLAALTNTNASNFRVAIGATTIGNALFTATNSSAAIDAIGISTNFSDQALSVETLVLPEADGLSSSTAYGIQWRRIYPSSNGLIALSGTDDQGQTTLRISTGTMSGTTAEVALFNSSRVTFYEPLDFNNTTNAATTRTNLGLGWAALTNTSASGFGAALYGSNTNPVLVNTNGEVVSPTNFWQVSPANTRVQLIQPVTNSTNTATNARNLYLYSLAISTTGVTNTVQLPTNGGTLLGDVATVIHEGPTSSVTAVRQIGSGTNIMTLNQFQEAVQFIYESGGWRVADNISQVEPIYFSGTNAADNAAASRTNLGLPLAALTNTNNANFQAAIFATNSAPTNSANVNTVNFNTAIHWMEVNVVTNGVTNNFLIPLFK